MLVTEGKLEIFGVEVENCHDRNFKTGLNPRLTRSVPGDTRPESCRGGHECMEVKRSLEFRFDPRGRAQVKSCD